MKVKVLINKLDRVTPGKRHGWYKTNVGLIRKPLVDYQMEFIPGPGVTYIPAKEVVEKPKTPWWKRIINKIKKVWQKINYFR